MAAAAPPLLPTSVPSATPATALDATTSIASADPAAMRAFLSRLLDSAKRSLSRARPWPELLDGATLSRPDSLYNATMHLRKNLAYFCINYAALVAFSLLAHPFSLAAVLALLFAWCLLYILRPADAPSLAACGRTSRRAEKETVHGAGRVGSEGDEFS